MNYEHPSNLSINPSFLKITDSVVTFSFHALTNAVLNMYSLEKNRFAPNNWCVSLNIHHIMQARNPRRYDGWRK
jgi:hypothetical protein